MSNKNPFYAVMTCVSLSSSPLSSIFMPFIFNSIIIMKIQLSFRGVVFIDFHISPSHLHALKCNMIIIFHIPVVSSTLNTAKWLLSAFLFSLGTLEVRCYNMIGYYCLLVFFNLALLDKDWARHVPVYFKHSMLIFFYSRVTAIRFLINTEGLEQTTSCGRQK